MSWARITNIVTGEVTYDSENGFRDSERIVSSEGTGTRVSFVPSIGPVQGFRHQGADWKQIQAWVNEINESQKQRNELQQKLEDQLPGTRRKLDEIEALKASGK